ncbi:MAG TPA: hypothetical protein VIC57_00230 [Candidatus Dormibacteraeota bacterium]|jgi:hypothetical protein
MTLRSDIHAALDPVAPPAPHLPSTVMAAVTRAGAPSEPTRRTVLLIVAATSLLAVIGFGAVVGGLRLVGERTLSPASAPPAKLVVTTWVRDPSVTGGPFPGYRPRMTSITPDMVASASAAPDPNGGHDWIVSFSFDARGARIFREITTVAAVACGPSGPGSCPEGRVTDWLDLTQADIDDWDARADLLYQPAAGGGKLLSDPYIVAPITGGQGYIEGAYTRDQATALARQLHP